MSLMRSFLAALCVASLALASLTPARGAEDDEAAVDYDPDLEAGAVMFRQCALCHGQHGQGILGGKYPRIGGLPEYYLMAALHDYKAGARGYDAMVVVGGLSTADEQDLQNLAAYISDLHVDLDVPGPDEGSARKGSRLYRYDCKTCHGRKGEGKSRKESPPLRSQYHEYLLRQIALFQNNERIHADDPEDETFAEYQEEEILNILAFIASLDDPEAQGEEDSQNTDDDDDEKSQ